MDVCILEPFPAINAVDIGLKLFRKNIAKCRFVEILRTNEVRIKRKNSDVFHFDGEPCMMDKKIVVKSHHKGLKVGVSTQSKLK